MDFLFASSIANIVLKGEVFTTARPSLIRAFDPIVKDEDAIIEAGTGIWSLVILAERLNEMIAQCAASAEPANLAKYTFTLARGFNLFYHRHRIIAEEDEAKRAVLIVAANIARRRLTAALATLGIAVPERM